MNLPISNQKTKTFKVGLYIRLSREDGDKEESSSITNQREILKRQLLPLQMMQLSPKYKLKKKKVEIIMENMKFIKLLEDMHII